MKPLAHNPMTRVAHTARIAHDCSSHRRGSPSSEPDSRNARRPADVDSPSWQHNRVRVDPLVECVRPRFGVRQTAACWLGSTASQCPIRKAQITLITSKSGKIRPHEGSHEVLVGALPCLRRFGSPDRVLSSRLCNFARSSLPVSVRHRPTYVAYPTHSPTWQLTARSAPK